MKPAQRVAFFYVPMGVVREEFFPGEQKNPAQSFAGSHAHICTRTLSPLDKMGAKVSLITGLARTWKDSADQHEQCGSCFLSSLAPGGSTTSRMPQGRTLDHIVAEQIGTGTPFRTLEFNCNPHKDNRESIRSIELQMDRLGGMRAELEKMNLPEPSAAHLPRGEYLRLIGDFMVAALQSGLTNVATMMIAPERWETPYRFEEISDKPLGHHGLSHRGWSEELRKIDEFHVRQFAYLVEKMDGILEADGTSLLDNTIFTYGSGLGNGAAHSYNRLPIIVAGSGGGKLKTGSHLQCKDGTPLANLWLTQAQAVGGERERFADSTGVVSELNA